MTAARKALAAVGFAAGAELVGIVLAAMQVPLWPAGPMLALTGLGAALYWYGYHTGYGAALAAEWDDWVRGKATGPQ